MPGGEAATRHAALPADTTRRRRYAHSGDRYVGQSVWPLWLSPHHGSAAACRLASRQGPDRADLASRRAEGSKETEAKRAVVAQRWIVRAATSAACEPSGPRKSLACPSTQKLPEKTSYSPVATTPCSDDCVPTSALNEAVQELAASTLLLNPTGTELQGRKRSPECE